MAWNEWTYFHETWYVASGTPVHYSCYFLNDDTAFYGKVKFGNFGFSIGKSENNGTFVKLLHPVT